MQIPEIETYDLILVDSDTLIELQAAVIGFRKISATEHVGVWEAVLATIEIELWSRGYGPKQPQ